MTSATFYKTVAKRAVKSWRNLLVDPLPRKSRLVLQKAEIDGDTLDVQYSALGQHYSVRVTFPPGYGQSLLGLPASPRSQLFTAIGMAFAPFFFKLSDFAGVQVNTAPLDKEAVEFFEHFLVHGLGEFRYLQGLNPARPISVTANSEGSVTPIHIGSNDNVIMLNGGGKDTIVAGELLKAAGQSFKWLSIRPNETRKKVVQLSGNLDALGVSYELDPKINEKKRYRWGHMPHTSVVLSIGLAVALVTKDGNVAVGNEYSANFGNVVYKGFEVNHQYTKSSDYERRFSSFVRRCIVKDINLFSILRPFDDLQLAKFFANYPKYFGAFISCNKGIGRGQGEWCKKCPKCAFTSLALYPFLTTDQIVSIFGEDVIYRPEIRRHVLELVNGRIKPWECVGTSDESALALGLLLDKRPDLDFKEAPFRGDFERAIRGRDLTSLARSILLTAQSDHQIPPRLASSLSHALSAADLLPGGGLLQGRMETEGGELRA